MKKGDYLNNTYLHKEHTQAGKVSRWQAQRALTEMALNEITNLELEQQIKLLEAKLQ